MTTYNANLVRIGKEMTVVKRFVFTLATLLLLFIASRANMAAQEAGSISGIVTDPSGATVANASVASMISDTETETVLVCVMG